MQTVYFGMTAPKLAELILYGALGISALVMLIHYLRSEKPFKTAFKGMASGGISLALLHFFGGSVGLALPLDLFTVFISLVLGIPGTAAMAIIELLLKSR